MEVYILHTGYISVFCMALGTNCYYVSVKDFAALQLKIPFFWICDAVSWVVKSVGFSVCEDKDTTWHQNIRIQLPIMVASFWWIITTDIHLPSCTSR
jgi:hypothetical protein